jgi:hypothetical protein
MHPIVCKIYHDVYVCCVTLSVGLPLIATTRSPFLIPFLSADDDGIGGDATANLPSYLFKCDKTNVQHTIIMQ